MIDIDPDKTLAQARVMARAILAKSTNPYETELADLFDELDIWMSAGGEKPQAWQPRRRTMRRG